MTEVSIRSSINATNAPSDPAPTGYDPIAKWTNYWNIITGRMTQRGKEDFREDAYKRNEAADCQRCDEWRDWCFKYSPIVIFLQKNIRELNGDLNPSNVLCKRCPARRDEDGVLHRQGGGFSPDHGILICANEMRSKKHLEDTLAHEMVHAWDHLRWKVDWADLRHAACTEVSGVGVNRGYVRETDCAADQGVEFERRVQMDERILHQE